jgi:hypothetical protein
LMRRQREWIHPSSRARVVGRIADAGKQDRRNRNRASIDIGN